MKTCPKCNGQNLEAANVCRLCATELPAVTEAPARQVPTSPPAARTEAPSITAAPGPTNGPLVCPSCQTTNDPDCLFCEHCGARLGPPSKALDSRSAMKAVRPSDPETKSSQPPSGPAEGSLSQAPTDAAAAVGSGDGRVPEASLAPAPAVITGPQPSGRHSALNMGLTTSVVCDACGSIQPMGGAFCADCGSQLSPNAIARALRISGQTKVAVLRLIMDGGEAGETYKLDRPETLIGRSEGHVTFPHDGFMSGRHALVVEREGKYFLVDAGSRNGTFIRIGKQTDLEHGDTLMIGKQVLKFVTN